MTGSGRFLNSAEAAKRLGVSAKALRLYEQRGLVVPVRSEIGWRAYGPDEMTRAAEIVALRRLGLSLAKVTQVLRGDVAVFESVLAVHQAALEAQAAEIATAMSRVKGLRAELAAGQSPCREHISRLLGARGEVGVAFDLPWPWGGERFELLDIRPLTYIVGPLGSGKTRLARRLAETVPSAAFLGLDRLDASGAAARAVLDVDPALRVRVDAALTWLREDGANDTDALTTLIVAIEHAGRAVLVIDMIEQGLDQPTQEAVIAYLRRRGTAGPKLFMLTRSSAILDPAAMGADEGIILCPANHSPPRLVAPYPGSPGYEAVATCLASPEVRARTAGVVAWRPNAA